MLELKIDQLRVNFIVESGDGAIVVCDSKAEVIDTVAKLVHNTWPDVASDYAG